MELHPPHRCGCHGFSLTDDNKASRPTCLKPVGSELIGRSMLRVPKGGCPNSGLRLGRYEDPVGDPAGPPKKEANAMSRQGTLSMTVSVMKSIARLPPLLRLMAGVLAVAGVVGIVFAVLGWMGPLQQKGRSTAGDDRSMTFSYSTQVGKTPAYDDTTVTAPEPVFRKLARSIDVTFDYRGRPGSIEIVAKLSTPSGWHTTMQLAPPTVFYGRSHHAAVHLDLEALDARAAAAASAIGVEAGPVNVAVVSNITSTGEPTFSPALQLNLAPLQLTLVGGSASLIVDEGSPKISGPLSPRIISVFGYSLMNAAAARAWSICLLLGMLFGAIGLALVSRRATPVHDSTEIHRRFPQLLVPVEPMVSPPGKPVVNVDDFQALVRLAERYGQLVLHWSRNKVETFVVRDEGITYRYRTANESSDVEEELINVDRNSPGRTASSARGAATTTATKAPAANKSTTATKTSANTRATTNARASTNAKAAKSNTAVKTVEPEQQTAQQQQATQDQQAAQLSQVPGDEARGDGTQDNDTPRGFSA